MSGTSRFVGMCAVYEIPVISGMSGISESSGISEVSGISKISVISGMSKNVRPKTLKTFILMLFNLKTLHRHIPTPVRYGGGREPLPA